MRSPSPRSSSGVLRECCPRPPQTCKPSSPSSGFRPRFSAPITLVVMPDGKVIGRGVNRVRHLNDVTAHAEVEALRDAGKNLGAPNLSGAVLLASGEPCALCYMASVYANVARVYYAADRHEAAAGGFDYRSGYKLFSRDPSDWVRPGVEKFPVERSLVPFQSFNRR